MRCRGFTERVAVCGVACLVTAALALTAAAQDGAASVDVVRITQRSDLRRQIDGKPAGLVHAYQQAVWNLEAPAPDGSRAVRAVVWAVEEGLTDLARSAKPVDAEYRSRFTLRRDGSLTGVSAGPAPFLRGFPAAIPAGARNGTVWEAPAVLYADPRGEGRFTRLDLLVQYRLAGTAEWRGKTVADVRAKYAVRYRTGRDPLGDPGLVNVEGTRDATIYYDPDTGFPVFARELVGNEVWSFADGGRLRNDGFILTFWEGSSRFGGVLLADAAGPGPAATPVPSATPEPVPSATANPLATPTPRPSSDSGPTSSPAAQPSAEPGRASSTPAPSASPLRLPDAASAVASDALDPEARRLELELARDDAPAVRLDTEERGVRLTLENIQFAPDSERLLAPELARLERIADLLKAVPAGRSFLIVGHTALAGSEAGQKRLSLLRAKSVVDYLVSRGFDPARFLYDGRGASQPVADNTTEAGKARNRRVEIIILD